MGHHKPRLGDWALSRRELLKRTGMGFGGLALAGLFAERQWADHHVSAGALPAAEGPLAPRKPHFAPRAKRVIHIFANGGPSHLDTFDPKPALDRYNGQPLPSGQFLTERKTGVLMRSPFKFQRHGRSGIDVSELFPNVAKHVDDMTVIRSMQADVPNHEPSLMLMNCGDNRLARPSMGSWLTYGLGTENQNLPGFVVLCPKGYPVKASENWQSAFLPGTYAGTYVESNKRNLDDLVEYIRNSNLSSGEQRRQIDLVQSLNAEQENAHGDDSQLDTRIQSFELAYRMQQEAADAFDLQREPERVREAYGDTDHGRQLLMARRLLERGVRVVQVWHGQDQPWDSHDKLEKKHRHLASECDQPIGALLTDLKERGMLEDTLVVWGGEFGRTPTVEMRASGGATAGRDHNHYGFSMWLAGGGVKGGYVHGATDEFGYAAVENQVHVHDLHATILHLMGLDHTRLTYRYAGRDIRLTDVHGKVVREILA